MVVILVQSSFVYAENRLLRVPASSQNQEFQDKFEELYVNEVTAEAAIEDIISSFKKQGKIPQDAKLKQTKKIAYAYALLSGIYNRDALKERIFLDYSLLDKFREPEPWKLRRLYQKRLLRRLKGINKKLKNVFPDIEEISLNVISFPRIFDLPCMPDGTTDSFSNLVYIRLIDVNRLSIDKPKPLRTLIPNIVHEYLHLTFPGFPDRILNEGATEYFTCKILNIEPADYFCETDIIRQLVNIVGEDLVKEVYQTGNILLLKEALGELYFEQMLDAIRPPPDLIFKEGDYDERLETLERLLKARKEASQETSSMTASSPATLSINNPVLLVRELLKRQDIMVGTILVNADDGEEFEFKFWPARGNWYTIEVYGQNQNNIGYLDFQLGKVSFGYFRGEPEHITEGPAIEVRESSYRGLGRALVSFALALSKIKGYEYFEVSHSIADAFWLGLGFEQTEKDSPAFIFDLIKTPIPNMQIVKKGNKYTIPHAILYEKSINNLWNDRKEAMAEAQSVIDRNPGAKLLILREGNLTTLIRVESAFSGTILFEDSIKYGWDDTDQEIENRDALVRSIREKAGKIKSQNDGTFIIERYRYDYLVLGASRLEAVKIIVIKENKGPASEIPALADINRTRDEI